MFSKILSTALIATMAQAGDSSSYNYIKNGEDWPTFSPSCGLTNQSPIDLKRSSADYKKISSKDDNFQKFYVNQVGSVASKWVGDTVKTETTYNTPNMFSSMLAKNAFGGDTTFTAAQFHFHAGSEHTIDGVRHDFEMHTVHTAGKTLNNIGFAAMGIVFSVNDYDKSVTEEQVKIIDTFFDSLKLENNDPVLDMVNYGDLMMMVNMNERWVYKGSVTTPPCAQSVYWNVLRTVYPIKETHLKRFQTQLARGGNDMQKTGNWRHIQEVDNHDVHIVSMEDGPSPQILIILTVVFAALALIFLIVSLVFWCKLSSSDVSESAPAEKQVPAEKQAPASAPEQTKTDTEKERTAERAKEEVELVQEPKDDQVGEAKKGDEETNPDKADA